VDAETTSIFRQLGDIKRNLVKEPDNEGLKRSYDRLAIKLVMSEATRAGLQADKKQNQRRFAMIDTALKGALKAGPQKGKGLDDLVAVQAKLAALKPNKQVESSVSKPGAVQANALVAQYQAGDLTLEQLEKELHEKVSVVLTGNQKRAIIETKEALESFLKPEEIRQIRGDVIKPKEEKKSTRYAMSRADLEIFAVSPLEKKRLNLLLAHVPITEKDDALFIGDKKVDSLLPHFARFIKTDRQAVTRELSDGEKEVVKAMSAAFSTNPRLQKSFSAGLGKEISKFQSGKGFAAAGDERRKAVSKKINESRYNNFLMTAAMDFADMTGNGELAMAMLDKLQNPNAEKLKTVKAYLSQF